MKKSQFKQLVRRELIKEAKGTSYESKLAEIEKQGKMVTLEAKIDALSEMIETKNNRLSLVNEDENLADLVDKKKIKEMQKEIKLLEKQKSKMEKMFEKMGGVRTEVTSGDTVKAEVDEVKDHFDYSSDDPFDKTSGEKDIEAEMDQKFIDGEIEEGTDPTYEEDELEENLTSEHQGYDDKEDESLGMEDGPEKDYTQSEKDRREDRYGKWGDRDKEHRGASLEESTNEEFLRMKKLAGIPINEDIEKKKVADKIRSHYLSEEDTENFNRIADLIENNNLKTAAEEIVELDTGLKELIMDDIKDIDENLLDIMFDFGDSGYLATARPKN